MKTENFVDRFEKHIKNSTLNGIIEDLPKLLREPCQMFVDKTEKEVFLIGALGVVSGLLPNIKAFYDGKWITPNLYVYILAGYAEGKGALDYARILGAEIHKGKREEAKDEKAAHAKAMIQYNKDLALFKKGRNTKPPDKPIPPSEHMLFIPANNSKSGLYQLLQDNKGKGIMFESEGDTLADAIKQDYGNFSDTLRKAFHHENLQLYRKTEKEYVEIEAPALSVILSSTFNQLSYLIPSIENGLLSRFLYYVLKPNYDFHNVFDERKKVYREQLAKLADDFNVIYQGLDKLYSPIYFRLPDELRDEFVGLFREKKSNIIDEVGYSMAGTANRLGIIAFRIMMILATLRKFEDDKGDANTIVCEQIDFDNAIRIVNKLEEHAITVMEHLTGSPEKKQLVIDMRKAGASMPNIERALNVNRGLISKWCKNIPINHSGNPSNPPETLE